MTRTTLIVGVGGGLLALLALAPSTGTALGELARARGVLAGAKSVAAAPADRPALLAPALLVRASDPASASAAMVTRVRTLAAAGGVLVERAEPVVAKAGLVRVRVRLSGPGKAVVALTDRLEREAPLVRFGQWRVVALADDGLAIEGELVSAWR